ncbi:site-specific integrase [Streptomyces sp. NPDC058690]|uniref:site-specific integrase n=1 Tax=Streptomyces sp. NPDC058690 TaxID=3346600 RepID=UPI00365B5A53
MNATSSPSRHLDLEQAKAVLVAARGSRLYAYLVLSLLSAVRTEEARPLTWDHVYLATENGVPPHVAVWRSVRRHGETRTRKSRRTIALPKQLVEVLEEHLRWQKQERASHGIEWSPAGRVFTSRSGEPLVAANVRRDFRAIVVKAGLEPEWTPRELRHSFVSLLSDHGIPLERIAMLVGHSSQATTEAVYRKQLRPVITQGAEAMDEIFEFGATRSDSEA